MCRTRLPGVCAAAGPVTTWRPSRSTVTSSQTDSTSSRKCEISTTAVPSAASCLMTAISRSVSVWVSSAVGSSMPITEAPDASARRISTCCCAASGRSRTRAEGLRSNPVRSISRASVLPSSRPARQPSRLCHRPRWTLSRTVMAGTRASSWEISANPCRSASRGEPTEIGSPSSKMRPVSGATAPHTALSNVDLPAPFSPSSPCTRPPYRVNDTSRSTGTPP